MRVDKQVLRLDVSVADAHGMDVRQCAAHLEHVQLHKQRGHALPALAVVLADAEHRFWHKLQDQIQVYLCRRLNNFQPTAYGIWNKHSFTISMGVRCPLLL